MENSNNTYNILTKSVLEKKFKNKKQRLLEVERKGK